MFHEMYLERGKVVRLDNVRGVQVRVKQGALWITMQGDPRDVFLERGGSFRIDRDGTTVLQAAATAGLTTIALSMLAAEAA